MTTADVVRHVGTTQQTYYRWRKQYSGRCRPQLKRLKKHEKENQRPREMDAAGDRVRASTNNEWSALRRMTDKTVRINTSAIGRLVCRVIAPTDKLELACLIAEAKPKNRPAKTQAMNPSTNGVCSAPMIHIGATNAAA